MVAFLYIVLFMVGVMIIGWWHVSAVVVSRLLVVLCVSFMIV